MMVVRMTEFIQNLEQTNIVIYTVSVFEPAGYIGNYQQRNTYIQGNLGGFCG